MIERAWISLDATPVDEPCAQVGSSDYSKCAKAECRAYINQLRREFGQEPEGVRLRVQGSAHDFGTYYEVAIDVDTTDDKAVEWALNLEKNVPLAWDKEAKKELCSLR